MKFDVWPWKTIGHLYHATSSSMHHFIAIGEFKLELQCMSPFAQFDLIWGWTTWKWLWATWNYNEMLKQPICERIGHGWRFHALSYSPETPNLGQNRRFFLAVWPCNLTYDLEQGKSEGFESCDRPIVRKRPIWVKIGDVLYRVTLKFDGWPWKTKGHLSFAVSSFVQHFIAIGEFKLELQSGNAQFGSNSTIFRAVWPCNLTYDLEKQ